MGLWHYQDTRPNPNYSFLVDAETGDVRNVALSCEVNWDAIKNPDGSMIDLYKDDPTGFEEHARQAAEQANVVGGIFETFHLDSEINGSNGYIAIFEAVGINGQQALIWFTKHDKEMIGVEYKDNQQ